MVYLADDTAIERELALKVLHPRADGGDAQLRAWEEARASAALRHPGVVAIYDLDEPRRLIAMELCRGGSLKARLAAGALPPGDALAALAQLCDALAAAHARGIVHGDVKPGNVLLRRPSPTAIGPDDLALCDFGIARLAEPGDAVLAERSAQGTLAYMAPEQRRGPAGAAADVYAAGVVGLELCAGPAALAARLADRGALLRGDVPAPSADALVALGPAADEARRLVAAMLAPAPDARPTAADAARAARALAAVTVTMR